MTIEVMWSDQNMAKGNIPYRKDTYHIAPNSSLKNDIVLVSPSQAVVQQAKHDLKRKLSEVEVYNPKKKPALSQFGEGRARKKSNSSKRRRSKKSSVSSNSKRKRKRSTKTLKSRGKKKKRKRKNKRTTVNKKSKNKKKRKKTVKRKRKSVKKV